MKNQKQSTGSAYPLYVEFSLRIFLLAVLTCSYNLSWSQDVLTLRDGTELKAKVIEVSDQEILYRPYDDATGPVRSMSNALIFMITYQNGTREVMAVTSPVQVVTVAAVPEKSAEQKFGGPRIGLTYISPGRIADHLAEKGKNPVVSQFGWQFEKRMFSFDDGPSGIFEFVPLIGGMEQGLFLPSASFLVGLRGAGQQPFECAFGPNISIGGLGIVIAFGKNFKYRNINFPVNIAYVPSIRNKTNSINGQGMRVSAIEETGHRVTLTVGFNVAKN